MRYALEQRDPEREYRWRVLVFGDVPELLLEHAREIEDDGTNLRLVDTMAKRSREVISFRQTRDLSRWLAKGRQKLHAMERRGEC